MGRRSGSGGDDDRVHQQRGPAWSAAQGIGRERAGGDRERAGGDREHRFGVLLSTPARQLASSAGVSLSQLVADALTHINALLPGPPTVVVVQTGTPAQLIPQTGTNGFTRPSGQVILQVGRTAQPTLARTLHLWLPRDLDE